MTQTDDEKDMIIQKTKLDIIVKVMCAICIVVLGQWATMVYGVFAFGGHFKEVNMLMKKAPVQYSKIVDNREELIVVKKDISMLKDYYHRIDSTQAALIEKTLGLETRMERGK
jgi:hypothetical protein